MKIYEPGSHVIATIESAGLLQTNTYNEFSILIDELIQELDLQKLGEVYHNFEPGGFTAVIGLSESHISVHTWPEYRKVNFDIYLSNYLRVNDRTVDILFEKMAAFFGGTVSSSQKIIR